MNTSYPLHKIPEKKTSKNGIKDAQIGDIFAANNFYAAWSGFGGRAADGAIVIVDWQQFHKFLLQRMIDKTAGDRLRYAKQFRGVLCTGQAAPLLELQPDKRIHAMKALASLALFTGSYDKWMQKIRQRYNLKWSTGNEALTAFQRFFDDSKSLMANYSSNSFSGSDCFSLFLKWRTAFGFI